MQGVRHHLKRPGYGLVQQNSPFNDFFIQRVIDSVRLPLHRARTYRKPSYHLLTIKQGSQENLKSYVQRFNAESLKIDVLDEKFAVTAFIVGLGVQSKDLMFSISKNPQANMAEVLAKAEKYINGEEALISKKESSSASKEKKTTDKRRGRSPKRQGD